MGYFKFPSFCICVVSKFSAVNMYYFYNKDKIITADLAKGCLDSLTRGTPRGGVGAASCAVPVCVHPGVPRDHTPGVSFRWDPALGGAEADFLLCGSAPTPVTPPCQVVLPPSLGL